MKKLFIYIFLPFLVFTSISLSQTLKIKTHGLSERDVARDTLSVPKYFDRRYNGLQNVGNQTKVFLRVEMAGAKLTFPAWSILTKPSGSTATFGTTKNLDTSKQVITFIPDKVGTYKIVVADGSLTDTITINSAVYFGVDGGVVSCRICHNGLVDKNDSTVTRWESTKHSTTLKRSLDGMLSSFFNNSCVRCHSTGYDTNALNDGFDDFPFVFPSVLQAGMYDSLKTVYPQAMALANVQCESCHGPGSSHYSTITDSKIEKTLSPDLCSYCHDSGTHHFYGEQYDNSVHANPTTLERGTSTTCAPCHSGSGFVSWIKGGKNPLTKAPALQKIACAVCHDPHNATIEHQLRTNTVTFMNGFTPTNAGSGGLCINCHRSRRDAVSYTDDYLKNLSLNYGPHFNTQGDMFYGTNAVTFGLDLPSSAHKGATVESCIDCHMADAGANPDGSIKLVGSHSLNMKDPKTDADNVTVCFNCHANFGTKFSDKKFYVNGNADLDQNGTIEGMQIEMQGLLDRLAKLLPPVGSTNVAITDSFITKVVAQAAYNYLFVKEDRSLGVHNPAYAYSLLASSISKLDGTTGIEMINNSIPQDYVLSQNYPNPFNPSTRIKFSIPEETNVKLLVYDILGREVSQLVNQVMKAGTYTFNWDASGNSSGIYFYKLQTDNFVKVNKMILMK